jgi:transposase
LTRYCDYGAIEIDNSAAEGTPRGATLSRKAFLFASADSADERAAAMYSLIVTAKLNGMDPEAYLRHILGCIAEYPINRIDEFLFESVAGDLPFFTANA